MLTTSLLCDLLCNLLCGVLLWVELLGNHLADGVGSLLSVDHNAEAGEVIKISAFLLNIHLSGSWSGGPFLSDLAVLPGLLDGSGSGTTVEWDLNLGELESADWVHAAWERVGLDESFARVSPVNNKDWLSIVLTKVNKGKSTGFNKRSKGLKLQEVRAHCLEMRPMKVSTMIR